MKLSYEKYGWRCVLGGEVLYILCLLYGTLLSGAKYQMHISQLELAMPGFTWGTVGGFVIGAIEVFIASWAIALFMVWMYNSSMVSNNKPL